MPLQDEAGTLAGSKPAAGWLCWPILSPLLFLTVHTLSIGFGGARAWLLSLILLTLAPLLAGVACLYRSRREGFAEGWIALAFAMLLWTGGMAGNLVSGIWLDSWSGVGGLSMLLFILYGVPIIFIAAAPDRERWPVRLVDGALALALGYLFFRHTFAFATMADTDQVGVAGLRLMFDIENSFIALFALVRFVSSGESAKRGFFMSLTIFAFLYLATAAFINHLHSDSDYGGASDLVIGLPFIVLIGLAIGHRLPDEAARRVSPAFAQVVRVGGPLMLPATLLMVAATLVWKQPGLAIAGCAVAILGYGLRSILVQVRSLEDRDALDRLSRVDPLTGLANRRQFDESLHREWTRTRRGGAGLALLMIDVDHFKLLNDGFGHPVGDERLRAIADTLAGCATRAADVVARYGGEEFAAVIPNVTPAQAAMLAETMRSAIERLDLPSPAPDGRVTVSIGIGHSAHLVGNDPAALLAAADAALYDAKQGGRNRSMPRADGAG
ncbi:GGDEF domain-containing protein [Sphingopyxis panaciterrae]